MGEALRAQGFEAMAGSRPWRPRTRVFIRDARGNGRYLRATWHAEGQMFVVSTWHDELCTGAVRVPVEAAGDLAGLLVQGLAEAATQPRRPARTSGRLARLERQLRRWISRTRRPVTPRG